MTWLALTFAGAWANIWHLGIGAAAIAVLLALAYFLPLLRKDFLWAAFAVALLLGGEWIGSRDATAECVAKTVVIEKVVEKAVTQAKTPAARARKDPYDRPNN